MIALQNPRILRLVLSALIAAMACTLWPGTDAARAKERKPAKGAAMVMDGNTGRILYNDSGYNARYPASLTKMMTIYMAFDLIEQGRLSYATPITISKNAAAQPPSKLGLEAGTKIKLIDALKALVTKSANDIAVAIAEHIGGSHAKFARMMTRKARSIGMKRTTFRNASGLPDAGQVTTARDMLILALRLQDHFPQHYAIFKTRRFRYAGKTYKNHNTLLGRVSGVDGIKTGYIRASGFNLVTSAKRNGRFIVAAVFGGKSARKRNARMRRLIARYLPKGSTKVTRRKSTYRIAAPAPTRAAPPTRRPRVRSPAPHRIARRPNPPIERQPAQRQPDITIATVRPVSVLQQAPRRGKPPSTLQDQMARLIDRTAEPVRARPSRWPVVRHQPPSTPKTGANQAARYQIQVGAYRTSAEASQRLHDVAAKAASLLRHHSRETQPVNVGNRTLFRARFTGFPQQSDAATACRQLQSQAIDCIVAN